MSYKDEAQRLKEADRRSEEAVKRSLGFREAAEIAGTNLAKSLAVRRDLK